MLLATAASACGNNTARAPNPTAYDWPDAFEYRIRFWAVGPDVAPARAYAKGSVLRFEVRNDRYLVWHDSLFTQGAPPWPADTLRYFVRLSRWGEFLEIEPACDPALRACHEALPSALPRELRHIVPRLPVWWPPKGHEWEDTLAFDDLPRPRGVRGSVRTIYRAARDTAFGGTACWIVTWHSVWSAVREAAGGAIVADRPMEESGTVFVDKGLLIPVYAEWRGAGAIGQEIRGRAILVGSAFDSVRAMEGVR